MANYRFVRRGMHKAIKFFIICLTFFSIVSAGAHAQQSAPTVSAKHCLWVVQTPSSKIFLLCSLHLLKSDAYPLAAAINRAYGLSQKVVFETDLGAMMDATVQAKMMSMDLYPEEQTLFQNIPQGLQRALQKKMTELGLPLDHFARFRPWFLAVTLTTLELQRLGFSPTYGIDLHFYGRATTDQKEIGFLEPVDFQLDLLGKMGAGDQNAFLSQTLMDLEFAAKMANKMVTYWKQGDAENLYTLLFKSFKAYPQIEDRLLLQRNKDWVLKIEKMKKEKKDIMIIVGVGHLIGPGSVVELLKKKGHKVKHW